MQANILEILHIIYYSLVISYKSINNLCYWIGIIINIADKQWRLHILTYARHICQMSSKVFKRAILTVICGIHLYGHLRVTLTPNAERLAVEHNECHNWDSNTQPCACGMDALTLKPQWPWVPSLDQIKIWSPSPEMMLSPNEWKILEWGVKPQTNNMSLVCLTCHSIFTRIDGLFRITQTQN